MHGSLSVAFDTTPLLGPLTGVGQFVRQAQAALEALEPSDERPALIPYVWSTRARRSQLPAGTRRLRFPPSLAVRLWRHVSWPTGARLLGDADVVHATNYVAAPSGRPTVITVHDCSFVTAPEHVRPVVRAFAPVVRRAIAAGAWVHAPSRYVGDQVRTLFDTDRVRVIPHGRPQLTSPAPDFPKLPGLDGRPYVAAVARLEPRKNLARLVSAFGLLHQQLPELCLVLAGPDGGDRAAIDAAIARLPRRAAEAVLFAGWLDDSHRNALVARAAALAYPSLDEGFGMPALEAMELDTPVVAANVGALPEVIGEAGVLVDPLDPSAIAAGLARAIDEHAALIAAGRRQLTQFSWPRSAGALAALYRDAR